MKTIHHHVRDNQQKKEEMDTNKGNDTIIPLVVQESFYPGAIPW